MSWGIAIESRSLRDAIANARARNVIVLASAGNSGLNRPIPFPASMGHPTLFCIGSTDTTGSRSRFSPSAKKQEKFSAIGEAVLVAAFNTESKIPKYTEERRDGTSMATPVAAGIASLLIAYTQQIPHSPAQATGYDNMRKLFLRISRPSEGKSHRFLAPLQLFESKTPQETQEEFKIVLSNPPGT